MYRIDVIKTFLGYDGAKLGKVKVKADHWGIEPQLIQPGLDMP